MSRPSRGEVWWAALDPAVGDEINKTRPVLVISEDVFGVLAIKLVAPITNVSPEKIGKPWLVPVKASRENGLKKDGVVDVLQLHGVSLGRLRSKMGRLNDEDVAEVAAAVALVVGAE